MSYGFHSLEPQQGSESCCLAHRRHVWFIVIGTLEILIAFALTIVYFNIRGLTTSLENVETIPTYANAILLMCSGILTVVLYIKRDAILLWPSAALTIACILFLATCAALSGIQTMNTVHRLHGCHYIGNINRCQCLLSQSSSPPWITLDADDKKVVFDGASSCDVITINLRDCMYILASLYTLGAVISLLAFLLILLVRRNQLRRKLHEREHVLEQMNMDHLDNTTGFNYQLFMDSPSNSIERQRPRLGRNRNRSRNTRSENNNRENNENNENSANQTHRRRGKLCRRITLPGMGFLNQQLRLPGDEDLRLISVQRTGSLEGPPESQPGSTGNNSTLPEGSQEQDNSGLRRTGSITPGVHVPQPGHVQRSASLEHGNTGYPSLARAQVMRSFSDLGHIEGQRMVSLFQRDHMADRNRLPQDMRPRRHEHQRLSTSQTSQDQCQHCREYRRLRRLYRAYYQPRSRMFPLPQHVMFMNYIMSMQNNNSGRVQSTTELLIRPPRQFEPPPPYQPSGPPPYSPGNRRSTEVDSDGSSQPSPMLSRISSQESMLYPEDSVSQTGIQTGYSTEDGVETDDGLDTDGADTDDGLDTDGADTDDAIEALDTLVSSLTIADEQIVSPPQVPYGDIHPDLNKTTEQCKDTPGPNKFYDSRISRTIIPSATKVDSTVHSNETSVSGSETVQNSSLDNLNMNGQTNMPSTLNDSDHSSDNSNDIDSALVLLNSIVDDYNQDCDTVSGTETPSMLTYSPQRTEVSDDSHTDSTHVSINSGSLKDQDTVSGHMSNIKTEPKEIKSIEIKETNTVNVKDSVTEQEENADGSDLQNATLDFPSEIGLLDAVCDEHYVSSSDESDGLRDSIPQSSSCVSSDHTGRTIVNIIDRPPINI